MLQFFVGYFEWPDHVHFMNQPFLLASGNFRPDLPLPFTSNFIETFMDPASQHVLTYTVLTCTKFEQLLTESESGAITIQLQYSVLECIQFQISKHQKDLPKLKILILLDDAAIFVITFPAGKETRR